MRGLRAAPGAGCPALSADFGEEWDSDDSAVRNSLVDHNSRVPSQARLSQPITQRHAIRSRAIDCEAMPIRILRLVRELIHPKPLPLQNVISGRIEIGQDGNVAYLEYSLGGNVLELIHTEVPRELRNLGLASMLAERALKWAR